MAAWGIESGHIDAAVRDDVAVITLRRPEKLNALTAEMRRELAAILRHFGTGELARGIVLTGTGRAFSAGEDLRAASVSAAMACSIASSGGRSSSRWAAVAAPGWVHR